MPAIVVFLIALFVAFLQNRHLNFGEKMHLIAQGLTDDNIITMCLILSLIHIWAGAPPFSPGSSPPRRQRAQ